MLAIWSLVSLPFLKPTWTSGSSWFTYCWSLAWRILSTTLLLNYSSGKKNSTLETDLNEAVLQEETQDACFLFTFLQKLHEKYGHMLSEIEKSRWVLAIFTESWTFLTSSLKHMEIDMYVDRCMYVYCCCSVTQSYPTLHDPMDCSTPGLPVHHYLHEYAQTHVHWLGKAIQSSHLLSPAPPDFNIYQHQGLQFHSSKASVLQHSAQPSLWFNSHICTWLLGKKKKKQT